MDIIEKLGITPGPWSHVFTGDTKEVDQTRLAGESWIDMRRRIAPELNGRKQTMLNDQHLARHSTQMLEALIDEWLFIDKQLSLWGDSIPLLFYHSLNEMAAVVVSTVESATGKSWDEIKELMRDD